MSNRRLPPFAVLKVTSNNSHDMPRAWSRRLVPMTVIGVVMGFVAKEFYRLYWIEGPHGYIARHKDFYKQLYASYPQLLEDPDDAKSATLRYYSDQEREVRAAAVEDGSASIPKRLQNKWQGNPDL